LDTNVIASAFRSRVGASNAVLRLAAEGRVTLLCSTALFLEYESVLSRDSMREVTGHTLQDVATVMAGLAELAEPVDVRFTARPMLPDADDEMVLEVALNGGADAIVTHNIRHFQVAHTSGVDVASPGGVVQRLML
jgi:putative PIN family toxin of toxin-antitoxin system